MIDDHILNLQRVIAISTPSTKKAVSMAYIKSGSVFESYSNNGSSHTIEHMLFQGTQNWPSNESLQDFFSSNGLDVSALTTKQYTVVNIQSHIDDLDKSFKVLNDLVFMAKLENDKFIKEKQVLVDEMEQEENDPAYILKEAINRSLYRDSSLALPAGGSSGSIRELKPNDIDDFYNTYYTPKNTIFCLVGNKKESELLDVVKQNHTTDSANKNRRSYPELSFKKEKIDDVELTHSSLGDRCLITYSFFTEDAYFQQESIPWLLVDLLTEHFTQLIRNKHGLAYSVNVDWHRFYLGNQVDIDVECAFKNRDKILSVIKEALENITIDDKLIQQSKRKLIQNLGFLYEDPSALADYLTTQALLFPGHSIEVPEQEIEHIKSIKTTDLTNAYRNIFFNSRSGLFSIQKKLN